MTAPDIRSTRPNPTLLGIDHLFRIRGDQLSFYRDLQHDHGDAVRLRLGPYRLWYLFHPDLIELLLTRQAHSFIRFRRLMAVLRQWNGNSLLLAEGSDWKERRRKVMPAFQTRRLPAYGEAVTEEAARLCDALLGEADQHGRLAFDADSTMARLALNIAVRTMFGAQPPSQAARIESAVRELSAIAFSESTSPVSMPAWMPTASAKRKREAMLVMDEFVSDLVRQALSRKNDKGDDLVSSLVQHHEGRFTDIRDDAMGLLIAGHETSGALLTWTLMALAANPHWLAQAQSEIHTVLDGVRPTTADLRRMPLVNAILGETLRLYPPAYTLFLREASESVDLGGLKIRRGDLVQVVPFITQRDPRFFDQPDLFDPSRFLRDPEWPSYGYLPFGAGPRVCIGQNFGLMEVALALIVILQRMTPEPRSEMPVPAARFSLRPLSALPTVWSRRS